METLLATPKEHIGNLSFVQQDVLSTPQLKAERKYRLRRAMLLGNIYQTKVTIKFRDDLNILRKVDTTIWAVFEEHISVKSGITIPIRAIEDIEF
jgi:hypothetical protein